MANIITNDHVNRDFIQMSNISTSVFFDVLCISGSDLAMEDYQKDLMIWFGQRDSNIMGMGMEGFDISEIIWHAGIFKEQKRFILDIIESARSKKSWDLLDYVPHQLVLKNLADFKAMIEVFKEEHIIAYKQCDIFDFDENVSQYDRCEMHKVYKNFLGCIVCNSR